eukprot:8819290-Pyramimonas_sp.AAC.1
MSARALLALGQPMHVLENILPHVVGLPLDDVSETADMHPIQRLRGAVNKIALSAAAPPPLQPPPPPAGRALGHLLARQGEEVPDASGRGGAACSHARGGRVGGALPTP